MRSSLIACFVALLATSIIAAPEPKWRNEWKGNGGYGGCGKHHGHGYQGPGKETNTWCLSPDQIIQGAEIFRRLIQDYSDQFALDALTEDFVDYSSAVNIIRNRGNAGPFVVNEISFTSRAAFMAAQGAQPLIPFDTLNTWGGCTFIATRWQTLRSANGQSNESNNIPVVGNGILVTRPDSNNTFGFRVAELYSEFNSAAWLVNNGVFTPSAVTTTDFPEGTAAPVKRTHPSLKHLNSKDYFFGA